MPKVLVAFDPHASHEERIKLPALVSLLQMKLLSQDQNSAWVQVERSDETSTLAWALKQAKIPAAVQGQGYDVNERAGIARAPTSKDDSLAVFTFVFTRRVTEEDKRRVADLAQLLNLGLASMNDIQVKLVMPRSGMMRVTLITQSAGLPIELALG